jgi:integrase
MSGGTVIANAVQHRLQKGRLFQRNGAWHVEYYREVPVISGEPVWRQTSSVLGRIDDYPKEADIRETFQGFMTRVNDEYVRVRSSDPPLVSFVEKIYFESEHLLSLSGTTRDEYKGMWARYLAERLEGETLGSVRPVSVVQLLEDIVKQSNINKYTIAHVRSLLSGIYTFARNHGHFDGSNPVTGTKLPKARRKSETYAYTLKEIAAILKVLDLRSQAAVATAGFGGLSRSEIQGFRWEDWTDDGISVQRKVAKGQVGETKTEHRRAIVPVIPQLCKILKAYWASIDKPEEGWVWPASRGKLPMDMNNLLQRDILPGIDKAHLEWHGWHAFRRGLASNLSELDVPDGVIQEILRHGDIGTTQRFYRKVRRPKVQKAMKKLARKVGSL